MPTCRGNRWHKDQEEADACIKHLTNHFDILSTISRNRELSSGSSTPQPNFGRSGRSRHTQASSRGITPPSNPPSPGPPVMDPPDDSPVRDPTPPAQVPATQSQSPNNLQNDGAFEVELVDPEIHHPVPERPPQPAEASNAHDVEAWLGKVASDPPPVPIDDLDRAQQTPQRDLPPRRVCGGVVVTPKSRPQDTTPPRRAGPVRKGEKGMEGELVDATPSKAAKDDVAVPAGPLPAWYQSENFTVSKHAVIAGGIFGVLFMIAMFALADRNARQYP